MNNDQVNLNLTQGMDVKASDGGKVGKVQDVQGNYVVVSKGFFFPHDYYIPFSAINTADEDNVYLNVTKDEALNQGWDAVPDTTTTSTYDSQPVVDRAVETDSLGYGGQGTYSNTGGNAPFEHDADTGHIEDSDRIDVALTEEELTARTRGVERGEVRIDKTVVSEEQSMDVPVTEERVNVSRRVVDREVRAGDTAFEEGTIEVPVYGEEVELDKRTRVREELEITKDQVQNTERVSGTVRHEEARITDDSGSIVDGDDDTRSTPRR
jgi:uncharacterized protein (TIGR02271 family)